MVPNNKTSNYQEKNMTLHFQREVDKLKKMILHEAAFVEESLKKALRALKDRDAGLANEVYESDAKIDQMEIDVEEEALKILALHQPVAIDLRFIIAVIKLNSDLERIGDLTANIARQIPTVIKFSTIDLSGRIFKMADLAEQMVRDVLTALIDMNVDLAQDVCAADEDVDALHKEMFGYVNDKIIQDDKNSAFYLCQLGISRYLERIADHATNIAEDVMYMVSGKISRHSGL